MAHLLESDPALSLLALPPPSQRARPAEPATATRKIWGPGFGSKRRQHVPAARGWVHAPAKATPSPPKQRRRRKKRTTGLPDDAGSTVSVDDYLKMVAEMTPPTSPSSAAIPHPRNVTKKDKKDALPWAVVPESQILDPATREQLLGTAEERVEIIVAALKAAAAAQGSRQEIIWLDLLGALYSDAVVAHYLRKMQTEARIVYLAGLARPSRSIVPAEKLQAQLRAQILSVVAETCRWTPTTPDEVRLFVSELHFHAPIRAVLLRMRAGDIVEVLARLFGKTATATSRHPPPPSAKRIQPNPYLAEVDDSDDDSIISDDPCDLEEANLCVESRGTQTDQDGAVFAEEAGAPGAAFSSDDLLREAAVKRSLARARRRRSQQQQYRTEGGDSPFSPPHHFQRRKSAGTIVSNMAIPARPEPIC